MKVSIYEEASAREKEREITLRLIEEDGVVTVQAVDNEGNYVSGGILLEFTKNMEIIRTSGVNDDLGFSLDEHDRLIEVD